MQGLHLTADLHDCACEPAWLVDADRLMTACVQAVTDAGLQVVGRLVHAFEPGPQGPGGVTATLLLAESHLCLHTWPERSAVTLDVYVCNFSADHSQAARALMCRLESIFRPAHAVRHAIERGMGEQRRLAG